jgi:hypothetical protein
MPRPPEMVSTITFTFLSLRSTGSGQFPCQKAVQDNGDTAPHNVDNRAASGGFHARSHVQQYKVQAGRFRRADIRIGLIDTATEAANSVSFPATVRAPCRLCVVLEYSKELVTAGSRMAVSIANTVEAIVRHCCAV